MLTLAVIICAISESLYPSLRSFPILRSYYSSDSEDEKHATRRPTLSEWSNITKLLPTNIAVLEASDNVPLKFANGHLDWNDFSAELDSWIAMKSNGPLSKESNWSETDSGRKMPNSNFFSQENSNELPTYVQKIICAPDSETSIRGDLHGDIVSLLQQLQVLQENNIIDDSFTITKKNYKILFLGDYVDRGYYGLEVIYTILRLMIANPENVIAVRGNHEDINLNDRDGFSVEICQKFGDPSGRKRRAIARMYDYLPSALYLGFEQTNSVHNFIQCCHGGFELGFNQNPFLSESSTCYQQVDLLNPQDFIEMLKQRASYEDELAKLPIMGRNIPFRINISGFQWSDYDVENKQQIAPNTKRGTGLIYGKECSEDILRTMRSYRHKVSAVIRGHQHSTDPNDPMMQGLKEGNGVYQAWSDNVTSPQRELPDNAIVTMNVAPDSVYGLVAGFRNNTFITVQPDPDKGIWIYTVINITDDSEGK